MYEQDNCTYAINDVLLYGTNILHINSSTFSTYIEIISQLLLFIGTDAKNLITGLDFGTEFLRFCELINNGLMQIKWNKSNYSH